MKHPVFIIAVTEHMMILGNDPVVFRKGIPFEFPLVVLKQCRLRPNQKVTAKQFWRALSLNAKIILNLDESADQQDDM